MSDLCEIAFLLLTLNICIFIHVCRWSFNSTRTTLDNTLHINMPLQNGYNIITNLFPIFLGGHFPKKPIFVKIESVRFRGMPFSVSISIILHHFSFYISPFCFILWFKKQGFPLWIILLKWLRICQKRKGFILLPLLADVLFLLPSMFS